MFQRRDNDLKQQLVNLQYGNTVLHEIQGKEKKLNSFKSMLNLSIFKTQFREEIQNARMKRIIHY